MEDQLVDVKPVQHLEDVGTYVQQHHFVGEYLDKKIVRESQSHEEFSEMNDL